MDGVADLKSRGMRGAGADSSLRNERWTASGDETTHE
jgi:hypothetical protein